MARETRHFADDVVFISFSVNQLDKKQADRSNIMSNEMSNTSMPADYNSAQLVQGILIFLSAVNGRPMGPRAQGAQRAPKKSIFLSSISAGVDRLLGSQSRLQVGVIQKLLQLFNLNGLAMYGQFLKTVENRAENRW